MARIRTVKPEFWTDPAMVRLSPIARLFYIGTWNFALCDHGHLEDDPFRLKLQILPVEDADVEAIINELVEAGRLARIDVNGQPYLHIHTLSSHQRVDGRWTPRCPACAHANSREFVGVPASPQELTQTPAVKESKGKESKGKDAEADASFDNFWDTYPKKVSKGQALKAYKAATKKATPMTILEGLQAHLPGWANTEKKFIPNPATWLNGERWGDEVTPADDENPWAHMKTPDQLSAERGF